MTLGAGTTELKLHIFERDDQTHTRIAVSIGRNAGEIVFCNDSSSRLRVDFVPEDLVKDKHGKTISFIDVPGNRNASVFVSGADEGKEIKYTARIGSTESEDPIIIIER